MAPTTCSAIWLVGRLETDASATMNDTAVTARMETQPPERAVAVECAGETLIGILTEGSRETGIVIVVGGPQYRAGSHRMFVQMARHLAGLGFPVLRFDVRGMGDSTAAFPGFEHIGPDISAAVDCLMNHTSCSGAMLCGLCDGASAVCMYAHQDPRIQGISLINPWVRTDASESRAMLGGYYRKRLLQGEFWRSMLRGEVRLLESLAGLARVVRRSRLEDGPIDYIESMRRGLAAFEGGVHIALSGEDFVAMEFAELSGTAEWREVLAERGARVDHFPGADHTFSGEGALFALVDSMITELGSLEGRTKAGRPIQASTEASRQCP